MSNNMVCYGSEKTVDYIFVQFALLYGHTWTSQQTTPEWGRGLKKTWLKQIKKMLIVDIKLAMEYLQSVANTDYTTFPPPVMAFVQLPQKIKAKSVPAVDDCYAAAICSNWELHPVVYAAAERCNIYWLQKQASACDGQKKFAKHYESQKAKYLRGELVSRSENDRKELTQDKESKAIGPLQRQIEQYLELLRQSPNDYGKFLAATTWQEKRAICRKLMARHEVDKDVR